MASDASNANQFETAPDNGNGRPTDEDLQRQVSRLRDDVAGIAETLKGLAGGHADNAKRQAYALHSDLRAQGEHYLRQAQDTATEVEEQVSEKIRAEPIKYVLIAAGVGYLYARLFH